MYEMKRLHGRDPVSLENRTLGRVYRNKTTGPISLSGTREPSSFSWSLNENKMKKKKNCLEQQV